MGDPDAQQSRYRLPECQRCYDLGYYFDDRDVSGVAGMRWYECDECDTACVEPSTPEQHSEAWTTFVSAEDQYFKHRRECDRLARLVLA